MPTIRIRVAGILIQDGKILLVRHEKSNETYWLLPGGGIEFGETAEHALIREFSEEVGIDIKVGKLVITHDSIPRQLNRHIFNLYFLVTADHYEVKVTRDSVLKEAAFIPLEDLSTLSVRPDVKREIQNLVLGNGSNGVIYLGNLWKDE